MVAALRPADARRLPARSVRTTSQRTLPSPQAANSPGTPESAAAAPRPARAPAPTPLDELRQKIRPAPQDRLARMVDLNEERTAQILRKWSHQEAS